MKVIIDDVTLIMSKQDALDLLKVIDNAMFHTNTVPYSVIRLRTDLNRFVKDND